VKNELVINLETARVDFLGPTAEGKKHDKALAEESALEMAPDSTLLGDLGFQGLEVKDAELIVPFKKPRGAELTEPQKQANKMLASVRILIEHVIASVKRLHIVKDIFRNFEVDLRDKVMEIACALHNFRNLHRHQIPSPSSSTHTNQAYVSL